jgi:L,D-peptidoglycan transpeptidase YkuD (ErfK/YbiS/YcfS/YnhG family)
MRLRSGLIVLAATLLCSSNTFAQTCPDLMQSARRLVIVTVPTLASSAGSLRLFERARPDAGWKLVGAAAPVVVGARGVAWGRAFHDLAANAEPVKIEGDNRTPAGFYPIGRPFGIAASPLAGYLRLQPDTVCVEDPSSPAYNTITLKKIAGRSPKENMWSIPLYRRGLIVDYPTDSAHKAGSCIFIHIWRSPLLSTHGCIVLPEYRVAALQRFANMHQTVLAVLPQATLARLRDCLPAAITEAAH